MKLFGFSIERTEKRVQGEEEWLKMMAATSRSRVEVNDVNALQSPAFWATTMVQARSLAQVSLFTYERVDIGKVKATEHPIYSLLHDMPNEQMTSFAFREAMAVQLFLYGACFAQIVWNRSRSRVLAIWPLLTPKMEIKRSNQVLRYVYKKSETEKVVLQPYQVLHIAGPSVDGVHAYDPMVIGKEVLGNAIAAEDFAGDFFSNSATPSGALKLPRRLQNEEQRTRLRESVREKHQDWDRKHEILLLEDGAEWQQLSIDPQASQLIEQRKFAVTTLARWAGVPPHMIGDLERATFSNIEHQDINYVRHTMLPTAKRFEQVYNAKLFTPSERGRFFAEHELDSLMRGDFKGRMEGYSIAVQNGIFSPNEVRRLENFNDREGGDDFFAPLNLADDNEPQQDEDNSLGQRSVETEERTLASRERLRRLMLPLFTEALGRVVRREQKDVGDQVVKLLQRDVPQFEVWLDEFYKRHHGFVMDQTRGVFSAMHTAMLEEVLDELKIRGFPDDTYDDALEEYVESFATEYTRSSLTQIKSFLAEPEASDLVDGRLAEWGEKRAGKEASNEIVRSSGAFALAGYAAARVQRIRWFTRGKSCPYCNEMNGRVVGISQPFLNEGGTVTPLGHDPMKHFGKLRHPPMHRGCDCQIMAA